MENLSGLALPPDEQWHFIVKCGHCGEQHSNVVYFNLIEIRSDLEESKQKAHYAAKCGFCKREHTILYLEGSHRPYVDSEKFATVARFECR